MPFHVRGDVHIHYQEFGSGYPVFLFAPGLMRSSADRWDNTDLKPREVLSEGYRVIAMDQRNAGKSTAPITATDGWHVYADDAIALIDHLGLDRLALWGRCIGPSFAMKVIERMGANADRVTALIDHAPIGLNAINRGHYMHGFYQWAEELPKGSFKEPVSIDAVCASFCENMFGGDFVFSVNREFMKRLQIPTVVLPGRDLAHPEEVAVDTARLAPHTEMHLGWQDDLQTTGRVVRTFLEKHRA